MLVCRVYIGVSAPQAAVTYDRKQAIAAYKGRSARFSIQREYYKLRRY